MQDPAQTVDMLSPVDRVQALRLWFMMARHADMAFYPGAPTTASLALALGSSLEPDVVTSPRALASAVHADGARMAAERLAAE